MSLPNKLFTLDLPDLNKKSAKAELFEIGKLILKTVGAPEQIDLKLFKYNIVNKLGEEIGKLSEEKAAEILATLKERLTKW